MCGPQTSSIGIIRELVRNAKSVAPTQTCSIRNSGSEAQVILKHMKVYELGLENEYFLHIPPEKGRAMVTKQ